VVVEDEALDDEWDVSRRELDALLYGLARRRAGSEEVPATSRGRMEVPTQPFPRGADMNIPDALMAAKAAYDLLATGLAARDASKIEAAMLDLRQQLWDVSNISLSQVQALHRLELEAQELRVQAANAVRDLEDLKAQIAEEAKYELTEIRTGIWARVRVEDVETSVERRPNFCPTCYSSGRKTPLQYHQAQPGVSSFLRCPADKDHLLNLGGALPREPRPARRFSPGIG